MTVVKKGREKRAEAKKTLKTNLDKRPSVHDVHKKGFLKSLPEGYVDRSKVIAKVGRRK